MEHKFLFETLKFLGFGCMEMNIWMYEIKGIQINGVDILLSIFADDTVLSNIHASIKFLEAVIVELRLQM